MRCLRIYATPDGESHFSDIDIAMTMTPFFPNEAPVEVSTHYPASRICFHHVPAGGREVGWHTPPGRVLINQSISSCTYSPDRNPDELVWKHLRADTVGRMTITDKADFKAKVRASMCQLQNDPEKIRPKNYRSNMPPDSAFTYGLINTVWLDGIVEFETSDREVRHVSAGGFVLVEDTHGKGHITRHPVEGQSIILITLPDGLDLPPS